MTVVHTATSILMKGGNALRLILAMIRPALFLTSLGKLGGILDSILSCIGKILDSLLANPSLFVGLLVITVTVVVMAKIVKQHLPVPSRPHLSGNPSRYESLQYEQALKDYKEQYRLYAMLTVGFVAVLAMVFVGGMSLAFRLHASSLEITRLEIQNRHIISQVQGILNDVINTNALSYGVAYNDHAEQVYLEVCHTFGIIGMDFNSRTYLLYPGEFKVVTGNMNSWGVGAGMSVRATGGRRWTTVGHGGLFFISKLK